ncbi:MAG: hypothetical protein KDI43_10085 [Gammaproteobacteria bacterium]|nr:hypothetical protein [Gammaproteobacteria bacterium]MCP5407741.1 hypothetical protein [Chromatiaceae bacterium]
MADTLFDLYFSGKTIEDAQPDQVRLKVGSIFGVDTQTLDLLFSGKPMRIKSGVDQDTAIRYRVALRDAGALLDIRPHKSDTAQVGSNSDNQAEETLTLLPPNTGNLIDCAIAVTPAPLPDIENIHLAPAGVVIDESAPTPKRAIHTEGLTLAPPNSGSLEDCKPVVQARPIPDITHIQLAEDDATAPSTNKNDH